MWKKYFKTPFKNGFDCYIFDAEGIPVASFTADMQEGSYDNIVACLNGEYKSKSNNHIELSDDKQHVLMNGDSILLMRGWGHLTGTGACNLPPEKAVEVQESMAEYICEQLNKK